MLVAVGGAWRPFPLTGPAHLEVWAATVSAPPDVVVDCNQTINTQAFGDGARPPSAAARAFLCT
ncbi:MAG: hypothetical protein HYS27_23670 [Deltaproteobacteria bacterium]|nr:hypothetical protein [Deltaproteobacteria bacterium]